LLCGEKRQNGSERIQRKRLSIRKPQIFARDVEVIAYFVIADHGPVPLHDLDTKIVQCEFVRCSHEVTPYVESGAKMRSRELERRILPASIRPPIPV